MARLTCPHCGKGLVLETSEEADLEHKEEGRPIHKGANEKESRRSDILKAMSKEEANER